MSRAQHGDGFSGIARAVFPQHVRHAVENPACGLRLANGAKAVGSSRIWRLARAGSVDNGIGSHYPWAMTVLVTNLKRCGLAASGLKLVESDAADVGDSARSMNMVRENGLGRERFEVAFDQFCAERILVGFGRIPAGRRQQAGGRPIDVVLPRGEQVDVTPLAHRMRDLCAGFQHDWPQTPLQNMRGRSKANWASPDDSNRPGFGHGIIL